MAARRPRLVAPHPLTYDDLIRAALKEDLGLAGDVTSDAIVPGEQRAQGYLRAREAGRVAGLPMAIAAFRALDPRTDVDVRVGDGMDVQADAILAMVRGSARALLGAERVALNFLGRLCGIATVTADLVSTVEGTGARIVCTRKTTPGLRGLEKYAVRAGGGANHRFGLDDAVLIKDNHIAVAGSVTAAVASVRSAVGHMMKVEVEVESLEQLDEALAQSIDAVLLDNMSTDMLRMAVRRIDGRAVAEASGGITPATARAVAETGVDLLSVGWLTHSAPALDVAFDLEPLGPRMV
jgi:nicotinate-nucleotide pyrophosphorylase (carboxylating)